MASFRAAGFYGLSLAALLAVTTPSYALAGGLRRGTMADAEVAVQAYLAMWSRDDGVTAASVARFYAPRILYFGKAMSRAEVLADKQRYIRQWPQRLYKEVPGSFVARCNSNRSSCDVKVDMMWRRVSQASRVSTGRARMTFEFVPADGGRKIARESARILRAPSRRS